VTKVHVEVSRLREQGKEIVMIGHAGHPEVEGTMGQSNGGMYLVESPDQVTRLKVSDEHNLAYVTQTTLSVDDASAIIAALKTRFPFITGPRKDDICYATQNRQDAVKELAQRCDLVLVVGSPNSSNSNRLKELSDKLGTPAYLIDSADDIRRGWLNGKKSVGVTAGASAPEELVAEVITRLKEWGGSTAEEMSGRRENVVFPLPKELQSY
jgi:4-hydroxy-3-methylbut-2-enyl diphosphate reductase